MHEQLNLWQLAGQKQYPAKILCPFHSDTTESLGVYEDHLYCFVCRTRVRRYAGAALLLGLWDGAPEGEMAGVYAVRGMLSRGEIKPAPVSTHPGQNGVQGEGKEEVIDISLAATFHRYLLSKPDTLAYFMSWRGFTLETIEQFELGWTGTHFTTPVRGMEGSLRSVRYRSHPLLDTGSKYTGVDGANASQLFSLPAFRVCSHIPTLFIVEGEYDCIACNQLGASAITTTNGAGSLCKFLELWQGLNISVGQWCIATDYDEAGEKAAWELKQQLPHALRAEWEIGKDLNEFLLYGGDLESVRLK